MQGMAGRTDGTENAGDAGDTGPAPARGRSRRPTITDVARHAGVSPAAVSKVLRDAPGTSRAMHEKVRASMGAIGYRPHVAARGLRGRTYTLGLLLPDLRNAFFVDLAEALRDALDDSGYHLVLGDEQRSADRQVRYAQALVDRSVDGLVLVAPIIGEERVSALGAGIPLVVIGNHSTGGTYDTVVDDDRFGARLVVDHLADLGHRRIAHIAPLHRRIEPDWPGGPDATRAAGYQEAMRARGLARYARLADGAYTEAGGYAAGRERLSLPAARRPTAVFAGTDMTAMGVLRAAQELGLAVPEDFSLVGYDDTALAGYAPVRLTSVDQQGATMGREAARLLRERLDGRVEPAYFATTPRLVPRATTAPPRG
jgi:LacI family transcriptional regulator